MTVYHHRACVLRAPLQATTLGDSAPTTIKTTKRGQKDQSVTIMLRAEDRSNIRYTGRFAGSVSKAGCVERRCFIRRLRGGGQDDEAGTEQGKRAGNNHRNGRRRLVVTSGTTDQVGQGQRESSTGNKESGGNVEHLIFTSGAGHHLHDDPSGETPSRPTCGVLNKHHSELHRMHANRSYAKRGRRKMKDELPTPEERSGPAVADSPAAYMKGLYEAIQ